MIGAVAAILLTSVGSTASETVVDGWLVRPMGARPVCAMTRAYKDGTSLTVAFSSVDDQVQLGLGFTQRVRPQIAEATYDLRFSSEGMAKAPSYHVAFADPTKVENGWVQMSEPIGSGLLNNFIGYDRIAVSQNGNSIAELAISKSEDAMQLLRVCAISVETFNREMNSSASADTVELPAEEAEELARTAASEETVERNTSLVSSSPETVSAMRRYKECLTRETLLLEPSGAAFSEVFEAAETACATQWADLFEAAIRPSEGLLMGDPKVSAALEYIERVEAGELAKARLAFLRQRSSSKIQ